MSSKNFFTAKELANQLSVNIMTIYRYIKSGRINAFKFSKEFRINKEEFERFLKEHRTKRK